jgi:hypothetical protein
MIDKFISQIKTRGLARTNRYRVDIPFPMGGMWGVDRDSAEVTTLLCDSVQIPGVNIATIPSRFYGEVREMPYEKAFDAVTMTFFVDSNMQVKTAFDRWMASIVDPLNRTIGYYSDYTRDLEVHVENVDGSTPMTIKLFEAYPKTVGSVQLDSASRDVMKLSVTWQYRYWLSNSNFGTALARPPKPLQAASAQDPAGISTGTAYDPTTLMQVQSGVNPFGNQP